VSLDELLKRDCIIDTSLLSNFVFTGYAHLLQKLVNGPVLISPAVLDPSETLLPFIYTVAPRCEFLKPLHEIHGDTSETYSAVAPFIQSFALASGSLWQPIELTEEELALAHRFSLREIWKETRNVDPRFTKRGLGAGEAEACAVAVKRNWTLLIDDQPAIELLGGLGHSVPHVRTCKLLKHAVDNDYISCEEAMHLFNDEIVDRYGFHATRSKGAQRLWFRCNPPECAWDAA
jgi:predicted nucleic acid-binding protein